MENIERQNEILARLKRFRLVDDTFMNVALSTKECVRELLRIILNNPELKVKWVNNQFYSPNLFGHSARLDIAAVDERGRYYNIEVQRSKSGSSPKRARYYSSVLDTYLLNQGVDYRKLPETYCIFIVENDIFKENSEYYNAERYITNIGKPFNDESHIVYFNLDISGDSERAKLAHDFYCTDPEDMYNPVLRDRVRYLKNTKGGQREMCEISQEIWDLGKEEGIEEGIELGHEEGRAEKAVETARKMLSKKFSVEDIADCSGLSIDRVRELAKAM